MKYNNTDFKISFDDNYVQIYQKLFYFNKNKFLNRNESVAYYTGGSGVVEYKDKAFVNSEFNNSDNYDEIIDEALLKGSKYSSSETLLKMNEINNFKPYTICRGVEPMLNFKKEFSLEPRFHGFWIYLYKANTEVKECNLRLTTGNLVNVKECFVKPCNFIGEYESIWTCFNPVDTSRDYNAKIIFNDEVIQTNSYIIPIDGTVLVDGAKRELDELIAANSKSLIQLGTATSCMIVEI